MRKTKTRPWSPSEHLETREDVAAYLEAAVEDGDPEVISAAIKDIAQARKAFLDGLAADLAEL